jgi:MFS family permease
MVLQEIRIVLPGVQVLSAFLLTAPFSQRFTDLDTWGRRAFGAALTSSMLSVILLMGPTLLHHLGERTARSARLQMSIALLLLGLASLSVALLSALWGVSRFVFGTGIAWALTVPVTVVMVIVWLILPRSLERHRNSTRGS